MDKEEFDFEGSKDGIEYSLFVPSKDPYHRFCRYEENILYISCYEENDRKRFHAVFHAMILPYFLFFSKSFFQKV
jgi:hypothetical protein